MSRFAVGEWVRISDRLESRHHRVPAYVKGRVGVVTRVCREQGQPELLSERIGDGPRQPVYRIRLRQPELWTEYDGPDVDTLDIEIFEHWLEPASGERNE